MTSVAKTAITPCYDPPGSPFFLLTAQVNNGKTYQLAALLGARVPDGSRSAVAPTLFLYAEASTEGTAGHLLADPTVLPWGVRDLDEAMVALRTCFPEGRAPLSLAEARAAYLKSESAVRAKHAGGPLHVATAKSDMDAWPIRSIAVDTISSLYAGQKSKIREATRQGRVAKGGDRFAATRGRGEDYDDLNEKNIAGKAFGAAIDLPDALSGIATRHRGTLVVVTCHATGAVQVINDKEVVVGEVPDYGYTKPTKAGVETDAFSKIWNNLHAKANLAWHLCRKLPNLAAVAEADINARGPGCGVTFGAVTERGIYPAPFGTVAWAKRQGGPGWLGWFDDACPRLWHPGIPWLGVDAQTGETFDAQAEFTARAASLPSFVRGVVQYSGGPDAGLLLELCLAEHAAQKSGVAA